MKQDSPNNSTTKDCSFASGLTKRTDPDNWTPLKAASSPASSREDCSGQGVDPEGGIDDIKEFPCSKAFSFTQTAAVWQVVLGENDRSELSGHESVLGVVTVVTHDDFNDYQNDIGKPSTVAVSLAPSLSSFPSPLPVSLICYFLRR